MTYREDFLQLDEIDKLYSQAKPFTEAEKEKLVKAGKWEAVSAKKAANLEKAKAAAKALLEASVNTDRYPYIQQIIADIEHNQQIQTGIEHKSSTAQKLTSDEEERYQQLLPYCQLAYLDEKNGIPEEHAKKLSLIFNDTADALTYLKDNMKQNKLMVHDACLFQVPDVNQCDFDTWKKLIKTNFNDKEFRILLPNAPEIEHLLNQNADTKRDGKARLALDEKRKEIEALNKVLRTSKRHRGDFNDADEEKYQGYIARMSELKLELYALTHGLTLKDADKWVLSACQEYNIINSSAAYAYMQKHGLNKSDYINFIELQRQDDDEKIPPITLHGADVGFPGTYLMKVPVLDEAHAARAACFGKLTHCCQSLSGEAGEPCVIHGLTDPNGGFYVVCRGDVNNAIVMDKTGGDGDEVLGQCWAWRSSDGTIVFDSIETSGSAAKASVKALFNQLALEIVKKKNKENKLYATRVVCGATSGISSQFGVEVMAPHLVSPVDYTAYRDSHEQRVIIDSARPYYFMDSQEGGLLATEKWLNEMLSKDDIQTKELEMALMKAATSGCTDIVEKLIQAKVDINAKTPDGLTALMRASEKGYTDIVEKLIQAKVDINAKASDEMTALMYAANSSYTAIVEKLIEAKADINVKTTYGWTALMYAANNCCTAIVEKLIEAKADLNAKTPDGWTMLMRAADRGNTAIVEKLIEAKADINAEALDGQTALMRAATIGYIDISEKLIEAKADINAKTPEGWTVLIRAAWMGNTPIVEKLIQAKVDINAKTTDGLTALMKSAEKGYTDIVEKLIQAKADIDAQNIGGRTALMRAAAGEHTAIVEKLMQANADIDMEDDKGHTVFWWADFNSTIIEILKKEKQERHEKIKQSGVQDESRKQSVLFYSETSPGSEGVNQTELKRARLKPKKTE